MRRALAIVLLLAACGGKSAPPTTPTPATTTTTTTTPVSEATAGDPGWWCYTDPDSQLVDCQRDQAACDNTSDELFLETPCTAAAEVWCMTWHETGYGDRPLCADTADGCADILASANEMGAEVVSECTKSP